MSDEDAAFGTAFGGIVVALLCLLWIVFWGATHVFLPPLHKTTFFCVRAIRSVDVGGGAARKDQFDTTDNADDEVLHSFYIRKLRRMLAYCIAAGIIGIVLTALCFTHAEPLVQLLVGFGPAHQFFFAMAIGHWTVNLWEDWRTRSLLGEGLSSDSGSLALFPLSICCGPALIMHFMYALHHVVTIFAYIFSLATHSLGGVMVQGLLFEAPVCFILWRDLGLATHPLPSWMLDVSAVRRHWAITYIAWVLGRGPAECLWVVSMVYGHAAKHLASSTTTGELVVYHVLGVFFTSINIRMAGLLLLWHSQDAERVVHRDEIKQPHELDGETNDGGQAPVTHLGLSQSE
eukprot:TRINITY_DN55945_c0_g1_i1.p1 TRINITY_DN55945_c0_g1~~TRINITY_DN55945_c0_g1_i1.p1  ORF type:complete len:346 (+),score=41.81 TRINITY_DN55945_c0_g1_i1:83-1120(+)